jgi:hypothetical protein
VLGLNDPGAGLGEMHGKIHIGDPQDPREVGARQKSLKMSFNTFANPGFIELQPAM